MASSAAKKVAQTVVKSAAVESAAKKYNPLRGQQLPSDNVSDAIFQEMGVSFASYLYLHGKKELAENICKDVKKYTKYFHNSSLVKAGELICNEDPYELGNISDFLKENFDLKSVNNLWQGRLMQLLNKNKPEDALLLCADIAYKTGQVFGSYYLFSDAFKKRDFAYSKKVFNMIEKIHGKNSAIFDMAFAMLADGSTQLKAAGLQLLDSKDLELTRAKLKFVVMHGMENEKYDAVNMILVRLLKSTIIDFNDLMNSLEYVVKFYYKKGLLTEIRDLDKAFQSADISIAPNIRKYFNMVAQHLDASNPSTEEQTSL